MNLIRERSIGTCTFLAKAAVLYGVLALAAFGAFGCASGPDGGIYIDKTVWVYVTNRVGSATGGSETGDGVSSGVAEPPSSQASAGSGSEPSPPVALEYRYGGVRARPSEDSRCRISGLKVGSGSLSFRWDTKIPSDWKRGETKKGPMILACAFYWDGSGWVGGKFDWIDEARSSRSLENIRGGYGGWNAAAWDAARRRAFCVMSADGRSRSNLIED